MNKRDTVKRLDLEVIREELKKAEYIAAIRYFGKAETAVELILEEKQAIRAKVNILMAQVARLDALQERIWNSPALLD